MNRRRCSGSSCLLVRAFQPDDFVRLTDDEIAEAADSLASTFETAARGLIFEHRPASLAAQRLNRHQGRPGETARGQPTGIRPEHRRLVLRRVEKGAKEARKQVGGDVTAYLQIVHRLLKPGENAPEANECLQQGDAVRPDHSMSGLAGVGLVL